MNLLRKLFGKKPQPVTPPPAPAPVVKEKPVISLDIVETTHDETRLVELAVSGETTQLRQAAANKIEDRAALESLLKQLKHKDKSVLKLVRAKLDTFKAADAEQANRDAKGALLCEKLERHTHQEADAVFKAKLALIEQEFAAFSDQINEELRARFAAAKARCDEKITAQAQLITQQEEQAAAERDARRLAEEAVASLEAIALGLLNEAQLSDDALKVAHLRLDELAQALRLAKSQLPDLQTLVPAFETRKQQVLNYLAIIGDHGTLTQQADRINDADDAALAQFARTLQCFPEALLAQAPGAENARAAYDSLMNAKRAAASAAKAQLNDLHELLRRGLIAVNNGHVRKARAQARDLAAQIEALTQPLPAALQSKYDDFQSKLEKLGDWHEFAVTPKKQQLILDANALIGAALAPDTLAERIHELQDDWREVSRGGQQQDDSLWQEFQTACAQAYAPCKEFFEAQSKLREDNLHKRETLVATLNEYVTGFDWQNANWKQVEQTLKVARTEWQTYWPVPRKAGADLAKTFESLMDDLHGRIKHEYDTNKAAKQTLVAEVKTLLESDDLNAAIERVKTLQQAWKTIGKTWHREDQQLWNQLREASDALFARRNNLQQEKRSAEKATTEQATNLAQAITDLALDISRGLEQAQAEQTLNDINARADALSLGGRDSALIQAARQQLQQAQAERAEQQRRAERQAARATLEQLAQALSQLEIDQAGGADTQAAAAQLQQDITQASLSNAIKSALLARVAKLPECTSAIIAQAEDALRLLAIRAEIARDEESPQADKALRMNYQVSLLQQGLHQEPINWADLEQQWWSVAGASDAVYAAYAPRFFAV